MAKNPENTVVPEGVSQEEVAAALDLLRRTREQRAKQREKAKNDPAAAEKASARALKLRIRNTLLCKKAIDAGIQVTAEEIDAYIAKAK